MMLIFERLERRGIPMNVPQIARGQASARWLPPRDSLIMVGHPNCVQRCDPAHAQGPSMRPPQRTSDHGFCWALWFPNGNGGESSMENIDRRSALALLGCVAATFAAARPAAADAMDSGSKDTTPFPGVVQRSYGSTPSLIPAYKTPSRCVI